MGVGAGDIRFLPTPHHSGRWRLRGEAGELDESALWLGDGNHPPDLPRLCCSSETLGGGTDLRLAQQIPAVVQRLRSPGTINRSIRVFDNGPVNGQTDKLRVFKRVLTP